jgi:exopolyphosphatase/pppGpp-phosphohydrolase
MSLKIYEVAYSEDTVHHKRFEAESRDDALALAQKELDKHSWDVNGAGGWEHGSGEGGHLEVIDELDKEEEEEDVVSIKTRRYMSSKITKIRTEARLVLMFGLGILVCSH